MRALKGEMRGEGSSALNYRDEMMDSGVELTWWMCQVIVRERSTITCLWRRQRIISRDFLGGWRRKINRVISYNDRQLYQRTKQNFLIPREISKTLLNIELLLIYFNCRLVWAFKQSSRINHFNEITLLLEKLSTLSLKRLHVFAWNK